MREGREVLIDTQDFRFRQNIFKCSHGRLLLAVLDDTQEFFLAALVIPQGRDGATPPSPDALRAVAA